MAKKKRGKKVGKVTSKKGSAASKARVYRAEASRK